MVEFTYKFIGANINNHYTDGSMKLATTFWDKETTYGDDSNRKSFVVDPYVSRLSEALCESDIDKICKMLDAVYKRGKRDGKREIQTALGIKN